MQEFVLVLRRMLEFISDHILYINIFPVVVVVFFERRNPKSVWAWLLVLYFLPLAGFVLYLLFGTDMRKRKMFRIKEVEDSVQDATRQQEYVLRQAKEWNQLMPKEYMDLILYNLKTAGAVITGDNDIDIFTDGNRLYDRILSDLEKAEKFIHLQYYILKDDVLFERIREVLKRKTATGVEVRILYDGMGCRKVSSKFWKELRNEGMEVAEFFPALFKRFHLRVNYRNHRKILVIDNKVAYVGGFNIGREYVDLDERFGHWRDTHLRICGAAIMGLQMRFLLDWSYAAGVNLFETPQYYQETAYGKRDFCKVQVIASGPDTRRQVIRDNYLRLIHKAEESILIQTPYFIPDEAVFESLMIAVQSGVRVRIMIPCKPDHFCVYWATYSYIGDLLLAGAECYTYDKGFLHAKGMVVDGKVFCFGTANMDIRSFALNFEINVIVYDQKKAQEMVRKFDKDIKSGSRITMDVYASRKLIIRVKEQISRLLSPLL